MLDYLTWWKLFYLLQKTQKVRYLCVLIFSFSLYLHVLTLKNFNMRSINLDCFTQSRGSYPEILEKGVLKICSKFIGEHPCRSTISIKLLCNFVEIAFEHGCSPVNLLHIFRKPFLQNTSGWLLLSKFNAQFNKFTLNF